MMYHRTSKTTTVLVAIVVACLSCSEPEEKKEMVIDAVSPEAGGIGTEVRITGSGFGTTLADVQVFFNEKSAPVLEVADTLIVTAVPEAATTGELLVNRGADAKAWTGIFNVLNGRWTSVASLPGMGRSYMAAFALNGKGYVTGGTDNGSTFKEVYEYDPATDQWTEKSTYPGAGRYKAVVFTIDDKGYVGMGSTTNGDSLDALQLYQYDAVSDQWTRKADFPGGPSTWGVGFSTGRKGYAGLGSQLGGGAAGFYEYNPDTDSWRQLTSPVGVDVTMALSFAIGDAFYVGASLGLPKQWWKYTPATDEWTRLKDVPFTDLLFESGFTIGNKGYVSAGTTNVWEYDPSDDSWTQKTSAPGAQPVTRGASAFAIGNRGYLVGGVAGTFSTKVFEFDPQE